MDISNVNIVKHSAPCVIINFLVVKEYSKNLEFRIYLFQYA